MGLMWFEVYIALTNRVDEASSYRVDGLRSVFAIWGEGALANVMRILQVRLQLRQSRW